MRPAARRGTLLALAPAATLFLLLAPIIAGLAGTLLPAFGYLPVVGATAFSLEPWRVLLAEPGLWRSLGLSLWTGFATTTLSMPLIDATKNADEPKIKDLNVLKCFCKNQ